MTLCACWEFDPPPPCPPPPQYSKPSPPPPPKYSKPSYAYVITAGAWGRGLCCTITLLHMNRLDKTYFRFFDVLLASRGASSRTYFKTSMSTSNSKYNNLTLCSPNILMLIHKDGSQTKVIYEIFYLLFMVHRDFLISSG